MANIKKFKDISFFDILADILSVGALLLVYLFLHREIITPEGGISLTGTFAWNFVVLIGCLVLLTVIGEMLGNDIWAYSIVFLCACGAYFIITSILKLILPIEYDAFLIFYLLVHSFVVIFIGGKG